MIRSLALAHVPALHSFLVGDGMTVLMIRSASLAHADPPLAHLRWKETVSVTSRTTETRFASNAPPERETTLDIA